MVNSLSSWKLGFWSANGSGAGVVVVVVVVLVVVVVVVVDVVVVVVVVVGDMVVVVVVVVGQPACLQRVYVRLTSSTSTWWLDSDVTTDSRTYSPR